MQVESSNWYIRRRSSYKLSAINDIWVSENQRIFYLINDNPNNIIINHTSELIYLFSSKKRIYIYIYIYKSANILYYEIPRSLTMILRDSTIFWFKSFLSRDILLISMSDKTYYIRKPLCNLYWSIFFCYICRIELNWNNIRLQKR